MTYYEKYLKYKEKYVTLKNQIGGNNLRGVINNIIKLLAGKKIHGGIVNWPASDINQLGLRLLNSINKSPEDATIYLNLEENKELRDNLIKELNNNAITAEQFIIKLYGHNKINCDVHQFMMSENPFEECINANEYKGECSEPSIEYSHKLSGFLGDETSSNLLDVLRLIKEKFVGNYENVTLGIHVGGNSYCSLKEFTKSKYNLNIYFDPYHRDYSPNVINKINELKEVITTFDLNSQEPITKEIKIKASFPLHVKSNKDKIFIDELVDISNYIGINFINAMCLSTFQTFYILKTKSNKLNFSYNACPSQNWADKK